MHFINSFRLFVNCHFRPLYFFSLSLMLEWDLSLPYFRSNGLCSGLWCVVFLSPCYFKTLRMSNYNEWCPSPNSQSRFYLLVLYVVKQMYTVEGKDKVVIYVLYPFFSILLIVLWVTSFIVCYFMTHRFRLPSYISQVNLYCK